MVYRSSHDRRRETRVRAGGTSRPFRVATGLDPRPACARCRGGSPSRTSGDRRTPRPRTDRTPSARPPAPDRSPLPRRPASRPSPVCPSMHRADPGPEVSPTGPTGTKVPDPLEAIVGGERGERHPTMDSMARRLPRWIRWGFVGLLGCLRRDPVRAVRAGPHEPSGHSGGGVRSRGRASSSPGAPVSTATATRPCGPGTRTSRRGRGSCSATSTRGAPPLNFSEWDRPQAEVDELLDVVRGRRDAARELHTDPSVGAPDRCASARPCSPRWSRCCGTRRRSRARASPRTSGRSPADRGEPAGSRSERRLRSGPCSRRCLSHRDARRSGTGRSQPRGGTPARGVPRGLVRAGRRSHRVGERALRAAARSRSRPAPTWRTTIPDWREGLDAEVPFEAALRCPSGGSLPVELALAIAGRRESDRGSVRDARELIAGREAQAALAEAESRYRSLVEQIPAVVYADNGNVTEYVNPQIEEILGVTPEAYRADPDMWLRMVHPDDRDAVEAQSEAFIAGVGRRPRRLPHGAPRRTGRLDPRPRLRAPRRRRQGDVRARDPVRRDRAEGGRGTHRAPRLPRRTDRAREPAAVRGDARPRGGTRQARRHRGRGRLLGPRQLQAGERLARPPRRRPAAVRARRPSSHLHAGDRSRGAPGRRRVPGVARRPRPRRSRDRREAGGGSRRARC